jgi:hypothetical protein
MIEDQTRLDDQLRAWGAQQRRSGPNIAVPVERFVTRRRRPVAAIVGAAAVIVAIALGVSVLRGGGTNHPSGGAQASPGPQASAPPGYQAVTFHGLAINVPSSWPMNATRCGQATEDTVVYPGVVPLCFGGINEKLTIAVWSDGSTPGGPELDAQGTATTSTAISGTPAKKITARTRQGRFVIRFEVPAVDASVTVASPDRSTAERLVASVRIVQRDRNGCPAKATDVSTIPTGQPPARAGAATSLLPNDPVRVAVCRYLAALIEQSSSLDSAHQAGLRSALNALPPGLLHFQDSGPECRRRITDPGSTMGSDAGDSEAYRIQADYSTGPSVVIIVRLGVCRQLGASNGTVTGKPTTQLMDDLAAIVGTAQTPVGN